MPGRSVRPHAGAAIAAPLSRCLSRVTPSERGFCPSATDLPAQTYAGARALLAEDNRANQRVAIRMLQRLGVVSSLAYDGLEAVQMAKALMPEVIFMDCHMPELDGFAATRELRSAGVTTPIIALTADALGEDNAACLAAGMDDVLTKPIDPSALEAVLARHLKARTPPPTSSSGE